MLGKLIVNEMKSYRLPAGIAFLVGVVVTVFMKIISILPIKNPDGKMTVQAFSYIGFMYLVQLVVVAVSVFAVIRFYNTMVGDRGYLTFTLPVKTSTHIWSKLIGGMLWQYIALAVVWLLRSFFVWGNYWCDEVSQIQKILNITVSNISREVEFKSKYIVTILLIGLCILLASFVSMLMIYMCMAIGQLFGKWRVFASFASFFGIIIGLYIALIVVIMSVASHASNLNFDPLENMDVYSFVNGFFGIGLLVELLAGVIFFAITNRLFDKHLNLE